MEEEKIIKIDTSTKVQFVLLDFFSPFSMALFLYKLKIIKNTPEAIIILAIFAIICFVLLISQIIKYNRFLIVDKKTIKICSQSEYNPKVIKTIKVSDIDRINEGLDISVTTKSNKNIKLLQLTPSILSIISYLGLVLLIVRNKCKILRANLLTQIYKMNLQLMKDSTEIKNAKKIISTDILIWIFIALIAIPGIMAILGALYYIGWAILFILAFLFTFVIHL